MQNFRICISNFWKHKLSNGHTVYVGVLHGGRHWLNHFESQILKFCISSILSRTRDQWIWIKLKYSKIWKKITHFRSINSSNGHTVYLGVLHGGRHRLNHFEVVHEDLEHEITQQYQPLSLQHYSEYRSTYKWHEFTPNTSASLPAASTASASNNEVVVKKPPKPISGKLVRIFQLCFPIPQWVKRILCPFPLRDHSYNT